MTTKYELELQVERLARIAGRDYYLVWAHGKPRLHERVDNGSRLGTQRDVSPWLPKSSMSLWLDAFEVGIAVGRSRDTRVEAVEAGGTH